MLESQCYYRRRGYIPCYYPKKVKWPRDPFGIIKSVAKFAARQLKIPAQADAEPF